MDARRNGGRDVSVVVGRESAVADVDSCVGGGEDRVGGRQRDVGPRVRVLVLGAREGHRSRHGPRKHPRLLFLQNKLSIFGLFFCFIRQKQLS